MKIKVVGRYMSTAYWSIEAPKSKKNPEERQESGIKYIKAHPVFNLSSITDSLSFFLRYDDEVKPELISPFNKVFVNVLINECGNTYKTRLGAPLSFWESLSPADGQTNRIPCKYI
jgi:hypothetical protein